MEKIIKQLGRGYVLKKFGVTCAYKKFNSGFDACIFKVRDKRLDVWVWLDRDLKHIILNVKVEDLDKTIEWVENVYA